ncbi:MAG: tol-pal system-associated acyl-CoA thioesterase [Planctomycetota bacterium]
MDIRVYYEDTDSGGVVYYANYLRFFERGRTEHLRERGISVVDYNALGILFVVAHIEVAYRAPARLDDLLNLETRIVDLSRTTFTYSQRIYRKETGQLLVDARVRAACIDARGKPRRLPDEVRSVVEEEVRRYRETTL